MGDNELNLRINTPIHGGVGVRGKETVSNGFPSLSCAAAPPSLGVLMRQLLLTAPFIGRRIYRGHSANCTPPPHVGGYFVHWDKSPRALYFATFFVEVELR